MTVDDIRSRVQRIRDEAWDDEKSHAMEDDLYREVLQAVAAGAPEPWNLMAAEALKTQEIDFARWCA